MDNQPIETKNYRKPKITKKKKIAISLAASAVAICLCAVAFGIFHPHMYKEWQIIKASTLTEDGESIWKCFCGKEEMRIIYAGSRGLEYNKIDEKNCEITSIGTCVDQNIYIPKYMNGCAVKKIRRNAFFVCSDLISVTIPDSVISIGAYAFYDCKNLMIVTIPNTLTNIEKKAFSGCSELKNLIIPDSVINIGDDAFSYCKSLKIVTIGNGVKCIGDSVFFGCSSLTSITIPKGVTSIGSYAFYGCGSLTSIIIPAGVTSIGDSAFDICSSLTSINYNGTISEWNAISKGDYWNYNTPDYTVYCTDGTITKSGEITYN